MAAAFAVAVSFCFGAPHPFDEQHQAAIVRVELCELVIWIGFLDGDVRIFVKEMVEADQSLAAFFKDAATYAEHNENNRIVYTTWNLNKSDGIFRCVGADG